MQQERPDGKKINMDKTFLGQIIEQAKNKPEKWYNEDPNKHEDWKQLANPDPAHIAVHGKKSKFLPLPEQKR